MSRCGLRRLRATACQLRNWLVHHRHASCIVTSPFPDINIPSSRIPEVVWETVSRVPDSTAIKCGLSGRGYTFAEVQSLSYRFANSLRKCGFSRGEVIAVVVPNCPEFAVIILGALEAGLSVSLINHSYTADEMCHQLQDSGSVCVVAATEKLNTVLAAISKVEIKTQSKPFRKIIALDIPPPNYLPTGTIKFTEMVGSNVDSSPNSSQEQYNNLAFLPYSSGTTGLSKGVCLSHKNIVANVLQFTSIEGITIESGENQDILLGLLPFYHIYGLTVILITSLFHGGQVITLPKFEPNSFVNALDNHKLTIMNIVPPLVLFLGQSDKVISNHLSALKIITSGAAPLGASDLEKVERKLPPDHKCFITQAYGMTETSPVATVPPPPVKNLATIGVPVANSSAKVINPETGDVLGVNECGELCLKGPQVMLGYHNNPKATSDILDSEGWLRTGDMAYYDEDNHFYIKDRLKELIKVKGFQVPPAELEEVLRTHHSITDVGVIGVPCPKNGETPVAYIVTQENKKLSVDEIKKFLSEKVSSHKIVSEVIFVKSIPKSAAGKLLRKELKKMYLSEQSEP